ncbi:MAG TPA: indole-3-glycerol phosphate synthase TrpC [Syntrophomonadaceae bacterium]|nr:indole-3-glycerol phosphate synthase TrpC [Syntrophomonadaceae bacterium]
MRLMILDQIVSAKREEVARLREAFPLHRLRRQAEEAPPARDFLRALKRTGGQVNLIAEIKRASPSRGVIRPDFDPPALAREYESAGAKAISVLTDERFFQGHPEHLRRVREAVALPVLRKDFIIDPVQIYESRLLGADAVLLIAAVLEQSRLEDCLALARELGMAALVEVHTEEELYRVLRTGARIIGINNRDLATFKTDLSTTFNLAPLIPPGRVVVSESGIRTGEDLVRLAERGIDSVLVGEALMRAPDVAAEIRRLLGGGEHGQG